MAASHSLALPRKRRWTDNNECSDDEDSKKRKYRQLLAPRRPSADNFPDEILEKVFRYLPFRSLICLEGVSKKWRALALDNWRFGGSEIVFSRIVAPLAPNFFRARLTSRLDYSLMKTAASCVFKRCQYFAKSVNFRNLQYVATSGGKLAAVTQLASFIPLDLRCLNLRGCGVDAHHLASVVATIPSNTLKTLNFEKAISGTRPGNRLSAELSSLFLRSYETLTYFCLSHLTDSSCRFLTYLPTSLETLILKRISTRIYFHAAFDGNKLFPALTSLELSFRNSVPSFVSGSFVLDMDLLASSAPNLVTIDIADNSIDVINGSGAKKFTSLYSLDIRNLHTANAVIQGVCSRESRCLLSLINLKLSSYSVDGSGLVQLGALRNLERLHLEGLCDMPGDLLRAISLGCPNLQQVTWEYVEYDSSSETEG